LLQFIDFKKPWDLLNFSTAEPAKSQAGEAAGAAKPPAQEEYRLMWTLLEKVRTFYEENPDIEF
jgi:hypothetical protein